MLSGAEWREMAGRPRGRQMVGRLIFRRAASDSADFQTAVSVDSMWTSQYCHVFMHAYAGIVMQ